jgi:serine/threonine protein kinase
MTAQKPKLNGFEFLECLGRGNFGEVWKARDLTLNTFRAIKIVPREIFRESYVQYLIGEAHSLAQLPHHRNRVIVHQIKDGLTNCFLVMDYLAGGPLHRLTAPDRPMPWPQAVRYIAGVGDGLLEMHEHGLLHRDIKPSNILLDPDRDEAVLGDFGLAVALERVHSVAGARAYMAPEVFSRRAWASPASDVYALAASLLHLVTGRPPSPLPPGETNPAAAGATAFDPDAATGAACWPADVPETVRAVIAAGMEPDPQRRADLPRFLGMLREARWQRLADEVLRGQPDEPVPVRLQVAVAVAPADAPASFTPLPAQELPRRRLRTGDLVRLESVASADGYQTILLLGNSGNLEVVLPRPNAEANSFAAGQPHRLLLRLTPPAGRERVLVVWSREDVRGSAREWQRWLERRGEEFVQASRKLVRGAEVMGSTVGVPPQGSWRALVIPLDHASPEPAWVEGTGQGRSAD